MLGAGALSMIRDWTPPSARKSAAERPVGPAPTIRGAFSIIASNLQIASLVNDLGDEMFAPASWNRGLRVSSGTADEEPAFRSARRASSLQLYSDRERAALAWAEAV